MPTTANGTAYTTYTASLPGHGTVVWTIGDAFVGMLDRPTILYAHGSGGAPDQWATLAQAKDIRDAWIDGGGLVIEGGGGTTDAAGAQNWGNAAARSAYVAYLAYVAGTISVGDLVVVGRSMGGLVAAWLATQSSIAGDVAGFISMSGVETMLVGSADNTAPVIEKNTVRHFGSTMWAAYGQTTYAGAAAAVEGTYSPEDWDPTVWDGTSILALWGDNDTSVPWDTRGGGPLADTWETRAPLYREVRRPNGDHGNNSTWLNVDDMLTFLGDVTSFTPPPHPAPQELALVGEYIVIGGEWFEVQTPSAVYP
jgi:pimeloyl-ACP methyl ester carboxylesterase